MPIYFNGYDLTSRGGVILEVGVDLNYYDYTITQSAISKIGNAYTNGIPLFLKEDDTLYTCLTLSKNEEDYSMKFFKSDGKYDDIDVDVSEGSLIVNGIGRTATVHLSCANCTFEDGSTSKEEIVQTGNVYILPTVIPDEGYRFYGWSKDGSSFSSVQNAKVFIETDCYFQANCHSRPGE